MLARTGFVACLLVLGCQKAAPEPRVSGDATARAAGADRGGAGQRAGRPGGTADSLLSFGKQDPIVNDDYRFRLDPIGPGWILLDEAEAKGLVPDALAGALHVESQMGGVVFVEKVGNTDIDAFHAHVAGLLEGGEVLVESLDRVIHAGRPAVRIVTLELIDGLPIVRLEVIAIHQGLAYHLNAWGREEILGSDRAPLERFAAAFSFTEGLVRPRELSRAVADADGVGWRLRDGVYEDAVYGIRIEPRGPWRVAVGDDLRFLSTEARVGLVSDTAYIVLIAEKVFDDRRVYSSWALDRIEQAMGISRSGDSLVVDIGGKRVSLLRYGAGSLEYLYGVGFHGDAAFQVMAWYLPGLREQAEAELPEAWRAITLLGPEPWRRLEKELGSAPDPQVLVGAGFALRDGVFTDFANGVTWTKPEGRWLASAGPAAAAINPDAELVIENLDCGIFGALIVESGSWDQQSYHRAVLDTMALGPEDETSGPAARAKLGRLPALVTTVRTRDGGMVYAYQVMTAVFGVRGFQLTFYGTAASMKCAKKGIARAASALDVPEQPPVAVEREGSRIRHHLLGFEYGPPGRGWRVDEAPMAEALGLVGAVYLFTSEQRLVLVAAFVDPGQGGEDSSYLDLFEALAGELSAGLPGVLSRDEEPVEFGDARWERMSLGSVGDYYVTSRGGVVYLLAVTGGPGPGGGPDLDALRNGFRFLD